MCEPVTLTMMGLAIASAAVSYSAQQKQATAQAKYQNEIQQQANDSASESFRQGTSAVGRRLIQNDQQAGQALAENAVNAMQARAHAAVAAGESGVSGVSVDALMGDFSRIEAANNHAITTNKEWATDQAVEQERGMAAEAKSRIAQAMPGPVAFPSAVALGLEIGNAGIQGFDTYQRRTKTGPYDANNKGGIFS